LLLWPWRLLFGRRKGRPRLLVDSPFDDSPTVPPRPRRKAGRIGPRLRCISCGSHVVENGKRPRCANCGSRHYAARGPKCN